MSEGYVPQRETLKFEVMMDLRAYRIGRIAVLDEEIAGLRTEQSGIWEAYDTFILERENERNNLERLIDGGGNIDMDTGGANGAETGHTNSNSGGGHTI